MHFIVRNQLGDTLVINGFAGGQKRALHRPYPPRALEVMSAEETVVAVAASTGAAVVAKTINTNKLADTLSKTRKSRWFRWVDINVPNDFAEADAHEADPNIIANAPTLETLGKLITMGIPSRAVSRPRHRTRA